MKSVLLLISVLFLVSSNSFSLEKKYTVSGYIKDKSATPISGVAVYLSGAKTDYILTDNTGFYKFESLDSGKTYKIMPVKQTYTFDPAYKVFEKLNENKTQTFTGTQAQLYSISGYVKDNAGKGVKGIALSLSGTDVSVKKVETDSTGFYKIENLVGGKSYVLLPVKTGYKFDPKFVAFENLKENKIQDFIATPPSTYSISGIIKDAGGTPIHGVLLTLAGEKSDKVYSDNSGNYKIENLPGSKIYVLTPYKAGYTFDPKIKTFENLNENKTQNFTGSTSQKYTISGSVKDNNAKPVGGVQLTLFGGSNFSATLKSNKTMTDSITGSYKFENIESGTYTLIPEKKNYTFTPKSKTFENLNQNQTQDFLAAGLPTYSISGYIKDKNSNPIGEVTVVLKGATALQAITDKTTGFYKFEKLPGGRLYSIYPYKPGYSFDPKLKTIESLDKDLAQDFIGTAASFISISGYVYDKSNIPITGATVRLSGEKQIKDTVDSKGFYQFEKLESGKYYALIPEAKSYTFDPKVKTYEPITGSATQNFIGTTVPLYTIDGLIKDSSGNAIQGVKLALVGGSNAGVETDNSGYYKFEKMQAGKYYLIVPSKRGYTFIPKYKIIENLTENTTQDFVGKSATSLINGYSASAKIVTGVSLYSSITISGSYSIIGIVQNVDNSFISNVNLTLSGADQLRTQSDDNGVFIFDNLTEGSSYTLIASKTGYMFDPSSIDYTEISENEAVVILGENSSLTSLRDGKTILPKEISLYQNYPNPFNPSTKIRYELPEYTKVKIGIYDIMGREVITLVNNYQSAGEHEIQYDAKNLSSGKYFVRLQTGNLSKIINILLLK
jgi:hypothetical protein